MFTAHQNHSRDESQAKSKLNVKNIDTYQIYSILMTCLHALERSQSEEENDHGRQKENSQKNNPFALIPST